MTLIKVYGSCKMADRPVIVDRAIMKEFLNEYLRYMDIERPVDVPEDALVEILCEYVEGDYIEWFNDNFRSFFGGHVFDYKHPDWSTIREMVKDYAKK
jgi:hypothetical protein